MATSIGFIAIFIWSYREFFKHTNQMCTSSLLSIDCLQTENWRGTGSYPLSTHKDPAVVHVLVLQLGNRFWFQCSRSAPLFQACLCARLSPKNSQPTLRVCCCSLLLSWHSHLPQSPKTHLREYWLVVPKKEKYIFLGADWNSTAYFTSPFSFFWNSEIWDSLSGA